MYISRRLIQSHYNIFSIKILYYLLFVETEKKINKSILVSRETKFASQ